MARKVSQEESRTGCLFILVVIAGVYLWKYRVAIVICCSVVAIVGAVLLHLHRFGLSIIRAEARYRAARYAERHAAALQRLHLESLASNLSLQRLSPSEFEAACATLFEQLGYRAQVTGGSGDGGVDVELRKGAEKRIVQCKHYFGRTVGSPEVREFIGAIIDTNADLGYFLTSGTYTAGARELAERHVFVRLWDIEDILDAGSDIAKRHMAREGDALASSDPIPPPRHGSPLAIGFQETVLYWRSRYDDFVEWYRKMGGPPYRGRNS